jgi:hypothetical protein
VDVRAPILTRPTPPSTVFCNILRRYGECHDFTYNVLDPDAALDDKTTAESALILWATGAVFAALCLLRFFRGRFCCWRQSFSSLTSEDDNECGELRPHCWLLGIFREWSDYEEFHNLTWLCCDLSWNLLNAGFWWPAAALTLLIACDATAVSGGIRGGTVDTAHYLFQLIWVISNCIWVYGDLYTNQDNQTPETIISLLAPTSDALSNYRFLSTIVCLLALILAVIFHVSWACISLSRSMLVPRRIQFLLSLEDDGSTLHTSALLPRAAKKLNSFLVLTRVCVADIAALTKAASLRCTMTTCTPPLQRERETAPRTWTSASVSWKSGACSARTRCQSTQWSTWTRLHPLAEWPGRPS